MFFVFTVLYTQTVILKLWVMPKILRDFLLVAHFNYDSIINIIHDSIINLFNIL
jgi:hypothetical protein